MIAGSMLIRSAIHALRMNTGYDGVHVVDLSFNFRRNPNTLPAIRPSWSATFAPVSRRCPE